MDKRDDQRLEQWKPRRDRWKRAAAIVRASESASEGWERLVANGLLPDSWLSSPSRRFGVVTRCSGCGGTGTAVLESNHTGPGDVDEIRGACRGCIATGRHCRIDPRPASRWVCAALAAAPDAALAAESLTREFGTRYQAWLASVGERPVFAASNNLERLCWADDWIFANREDLRYIGPTPDDWADARTRAAIRERCRFVRGDDDANGLAATLRIVLGFEVLARVTDSRAAARPADPHPAKLLQEILALGYAFTGSDWGCGVLVPRPPRPWIHELD